MGAYLQKSWVWCQELMCLHLQAQLDLPIACFLNHDDGQDENLSMYHLSYPYQQAPTSISEIQCNECFLKCKECCQISNPEVVNILKLYIRIPINPGMLARNLWILDQQITRWNSSKSEREPRCICWLHAALSPMRKPRDNHQREDASCTSNRKWWWHVLHYLPEKKKKVHYAHYKWIGENYFDPLYILEQILLMFHCLCEILDYPLNHLLYKLFALLQAASSPVDA